MHFKLFVSRGSNGSEVIKVPQLAHFQSPENVGRSLVAGVVAMPISSAEAGSVANSASSGIAGASDATGISFACWLSFDLA